MLYGLIGTNVRILPLLRISIPLSVNLSTQIWTVDGDFIPIPAHISLIEGDILFSFRYLTIYSSTAASFLIRFIAIPLIR
jgi:hypothetical protein